MPVSRFFHRARRTLTVLFAAALLSSCNGPEQKNPSAVPQGFSAAALSEAQARVDDAMELAGQVGHEEVIRRINEDKAFWDGATYVFVLNARSRTSLANPVFPALIGKHESEVTDAAGNSLAALVDEADEDGAWVEYQWVNPETAKPARKVSWVKKIGDYVYGSGVYR